MNEIPYEKCKTVCSAEWSEPSEIILFHGEG